VLAQTDAMTGLLNHAHGIKRLETEVSKAHRYGRRLSIVMLDLDLFKRINDEYGHQAGDEVIVRFSDCLRQSSRVFDVAIRYGGEEFLLILPETGLESALVVGERIRTRLLESTLCASTAITVSGGIVECMPDDTADLMIKRADDLLYRAKQSGRDRIIAE
jgi:diguanylate cyclase (GGDEF)-like protein